MTATAFSLRLRLTVIILTPLLIIASIVGVWQLENAQETATDVFDRSLLSAALAVSNDVSISGGDALSNETRDILADTAGGPVYYHVFAPDGVIVAGYATPPVGIPSIPIEASAPLYFNAQYFGQAVNGVRLQMRSEIDGVSGVFTTTVWQETQVREDFLKRLLFRSVGAILGLTLTVALVVWFGVRIGLTPLFDLRRAIALRNSDELSPIKRSVPDEVRGIVATLNRLFEQVSQSMTAQSDFISNAAHQLRNPIAGVLSLAEAVLSARGEAETKRRAKDLLIAAKSTAELSNKLLTIERAKQLSPEKLKQTINLVTAIEAWETRFVDLLKDRARLTIVKDTQCDPIHCDSTMIREALTNLIDNALKHGGAEMTHVTLRYIQTHSHILLSVEDNGCGVQRDDRSKITERFFQTVESTGQGTGLGLTLVETVAETHGGKIEIRNNNPGLKVIMSLALNA